MLKTLFAPATNTPRRALATLAMLTLAVVLGSGLPAPKAAHADLISAFQEHQALAIPINGRIEKVKFASPALGNSRDVYVYLPPGYNPRSAQTYPVIVLLHGTPGQPVDWLYKGEAHKSLDDAIHNGHMPASILVIADGRGPFYKGGSEWADDVNGKCRMETSIAQDLPRFLRSRYRVSDNPSQWTIGGLSEGGSGAANIAIHYPDVYRNVLVLSGEFLVDEDWPDTHDVFGDNLTVHQHYSPLFQLRHVAAADRSKLHFYVAVGQNDDEDLQRQCDQFVGLCKTLGVAVRYDHDAGGHKWPFWTGHFRTALDPLSNWLLTGARSAHS